MCNIIRNKQKKVLPNDNIELSNKIRKPVLMRVLETLSSKKYFESDSKSEEKEAKKIFKALSFSITKQSDEGLGSLVGEEWVTKNNKLNLTDIKHISDFEPEIFKKTVADKVSEILRTKCVTQFLGEKYILPDNPSYWHKIKHPFKQVMNEAARYGTQKKIKQYDGNRVEMSGLSENTRILHGNIFPESHNYTIVIPGIHTIDKEFYDYFQSMCFFSEKQSANTIGINTFYTPNDKEKSFGHILAKIEAIIEGIIKKDPNAKIVLASHSAGSIFSVKLLEKYESIVNMKALNFAPALDCNNVFSESLKRMYKIICGEEFCHLKYGERGITFLGEGDDVIFETHWPSISIKGNHDSCFQHIENQECFTDAFSEIFKEEDAKT